MNDKPYETATPIILMVPWDERFNVVDEWTGFKNQRIPKEHPNKPGWFAHDIIIEGCGKAVVTEAMVGYSHAKIKIGFAKP